MAALSRARRGVGEVGDRTYYKIISISATTSILEKKTYRITTKEPNILLHPLQTRPLIP